MGRILAAAQRTSTPESALIPALSSLDKLESDGLPTEHFVERMVECISKGASADSLRVRAEGTVEDTRAARLLVDGDEGAGAEGMRMSFKRCSARWELEHCLRRSCGSGRRRRVFGARARGGDRAGAASREVPAEAGVRLARDLLGQGAGAAGAAVPAAPGDRVAPVALAAAPEAAEPEAVEAAAEGKAP